MTIDKEEFGRTRQKIVYGVMETMVDKDGNYVPFIVKEGEKGYYPTDFHWGKKFEIAKRCAREQNEKMGISEREAMELILASIHFPKR